jgi:hypothetical protein
MTGNRQNADGQLVEVVANSDTDSADDSSDADDRMVQRGRRQLQDPEQQRQGLCSWVGVGL